jgi:hemoglobin
MTAPTQNSPKTLYERMGGYDVIAGIVDDLTLRMRNDPQFRRFAARSEDSRKRARQLFVDQLSALAGGPSIYVGRDMKTSHAGLGITQQEWQASIHHAEAAFDNFHISPQDKTDFIALLERYRAEIVER